MSMLFSLWLALLPVLSLSAADSRGPKGPETPAPVAAPAILPSVPALPGTALPVAPALETSAPALPVAPALETGRPDAVDRAIRGAFDSLQQQVSRRAAASGERPEAGAERAASSDQDPASAPTRARRGRGLELSAEQLRNAPPFIRALLGASGGRAVVVLERVADIDVSLDELFGERHVSAPAVSEEERLFSEANPGSDAPRFLREQGGDFGQLAREMLLEETFKSRRGLLSTVNPFYARTVEEILDFAAKAETDPRARAFAETAGVNFARQDVPPVWGDLMLNVGLGRRPPPGMFLPRPALSGGEYWDLAAGLHTPMRSMDGLDSTTIYRFFDISHFAVAGINEGFRLLNEYTQGLFRQASAERQDIRTLQKPEAPLSVIRSKNVTNYVPGFETKLEEMADWIAPGGQLFVQNEGGNWAHRQTVVRDLGGMARRLIMAGWGFDYTLERAGMGLDLLTFTKPGAMGRYFSFGRRSAERRWQNFVDDAPPLGGGW